MSLTISTPKLALQAGGLTFPFLGVGGVPPYSYSLLQGAGSIDPVSGIYTSPLAVPCLDDPLIMVQVTDSAPTPANATAKIAVCTVPELVLDILARELCISPTRVWLWDQKVFKPTDEGLFIAVAVLYDKIMGQTNRFDPVTGSQVQSVNTAARLQIDIMSRGPSARDRRHEVIMALGSVYAQQQCALNSFAIGPVASDFRNLSEIDGAAIPYRFMIEVTLNYFSVKQSAVPYFDTFPGVATPVVEA